MGSCRDSRVLRPQQPGPAPGGLGIEPPGPGARPGWSPGGPQPPGLGRARSRPTSRNGDGVPLSGGVTRATDTCSRASPRLGSCSPPGESPQSSVTALPRAGCGFWPRGQGWAGQGRAAPSGSFKGVGGGFGADWSPRPGPARSCPLPSCPHLSCPHPGTSSARPLLHSQRPRPAKPTKKHKKWDAWGRLGLQLAESPRRPEAVWLWKS